MILRIVKPTFKLPPYIRAIATEAARHHDLEAFQQAQALAQLELIKFNQQ